MRSEASGLALAIYNRRKASSKAIWFYGTATSGSGAIQFPSCAGTLQEEQEFHLSLTLRVERHPTGKFSAAALDGVNGLRIRRFSLDDLLM
jgi:hypothetical protein